MSLAIWALIIGALLITVALSGSLLRRLPVSTAMLYLAAGYGLGPAGWAFMAPDPLSYSAILEAVTEVAVLISLFAAGLKLGVPLSDRRWHLPVRLALVSMALTVAFITAIGMLGLGLSLGAALCSERSLRPPTLSVWLGLLGVPVSVSRDQRTLISWFGIRGIGSIYYLMYAINHGLPRSLSEEIIAITLTVVTVSIVVHGISVTPLMSLYARRKARRTHR